MAPATFFGGMALAAAAVCFGLGGVEGRASSLVLGIAGLSWLLGPGGDRGGE